MNYAFMLSDSQWDEVKQDFEMKRRKRKQSLQVTLSAVICLLRTGCQWRMLPEDIYGKWQLVHYYYRKWMAYWKGCGTGWLVRCVNKRGKQRSHLRQSLTHKVLRVQPA